SAFASLQTASVFSKRSFLIPSFMSRFSLPNLLFLSPRFSLRVGILEQLQNRATTLCCFLQKSFVRSIQFAFSCRFAPHFMALDLVFSLSAKSDSRKTTICLRKHAIFKL
ncbi:MAG: hypothetical protein WAW39_22570, partial [Prosthecobacter sp.]|uniref:hypothetical protein n=1 Tax=Prosthecobacter sp. TaxID=1965333 RepID=UPI003BB16CEC